MFKHYFGLGIYTVPGDIDDHYGFMMDDFGYLVPITEYQFDQRVYQRTGKIL